MSFYRTRRTSTAPAGNRGLKTLHHIERFIEESKHAPAVIEPSRTQVAHQFTDFDLPETVFEAISKAGYLQPTPIQDKVIPVVLSGADIIGIANTGTGKTAAFLLPLISRFNKKEIQKVIILTPTRELALQIQQDFYTFTRNTNLRSVLCIGGTSVGKQISQLKRPYDVLVGTPGRIKDMLNQHHLRFSEFDVVVLDEVDRMLDMGFIHDVRELLHQLPEQRQTLFFSATLPSEVERLCQSFAKHPVKLSTQITEYVNTVTQQLIKLTPNQKKIDVLYDLLCHQSEFKKVIIFGRTKHGVKRLARELDSRGFAVESIHGNKTQAARQKSLDYFKSGRIAILVATDVAARGIDVTNITHVINYDLPETIEDYIHRIGRTGRAGNSGVALTLA